MSISDILAGFARGIATPSQLLPEHRKLLRELIWQWLHGTTDGAVALRAASSADSALDSVEKLICDGFLVATFDPETEIFTIKPAGARI